MPGGARVSRAVLPLLQLDSRDALAYESEPPMLEPARIYFVIFGILTILGGVMGYVKAQSTVSLIAGGVSGILLLLADYLLPGNLVAGLVLALVVSLLLFGQFLPRFIRTRKLMPAGLMTLLSLIGIGMAVAAWVKS